jgi:hypothetical protein
VVHGAYKLARPFLLHLALAHPGTLAVAWVEPGIVPWLSRRRRVLLEELFLLPGRALLLLHLRRSRRRRRLLHRGLRLGLGLLRLGRACLAAFVLAAAPAAPMPLRLPGPCGRSWPQFRLRLCRFCRHALLPGTLHLVALPCQFSALSLPSADLAPNFRSACRLPVSDRDIERPKIQSFKSFEQSAAE